MLDVQLSARATVVPEVVHFAATLVGKTIDSYKLTSLIGEGGMGMIYVGEHVTLGRKVAIKVLRPELAFHQDAVNRFFNEAKTVNHIGHPNIVDIIDFKSDTHCSPPLVYMVMELLEGQNLADRIDQDGVFEEADTLEILLQVVDALEAVHKLDILHRDLKPENIFLTKDSDGPRGVGRTIKLLDFGVVKVLNKSPDMAVTNPGQAIGTPEIMAPEQIVDRPLSPATDIYGLGILMFRMLTGRAPFQAKSYNQLMEMHLKAEPSRVNERRTDAGQSEISDALEAVIQKCLKKDPTHRFQSCEELMTALEGCGSGAQDLDLPADEADLTDDEADLTDDEADLTDDEVLRAGWLSHVLRPRILMPAAAALTVAIFALVLGAQPSAPEPGEIVQTPTLPETRPTQVAVATRPDQPPSSSVIGSATLDAHDGSSPAARQMPPLSMSGDQRQELVKAEPPATDTSRERMGKASRRGQPARAKATRASSRSKKRSPRVPGKNLDYQAGTIDPFAL